MRKCPEIILRLGTSMNINEAKQIHHQLHANIHSK